jgi:hypothetical protein
MRFNFLGIFGQALRFTFFLYFAKSAQTKQNCRLLFVTSGNHLELLLSTKDDISGIFHQIPSIFWSQKGSFIYSDFWLICIDLYSYFLFG